MNYCQTALVNIISNHEYFLISITFVFCICLAHPLHFSKLCSVGERLFSRTVTDARSRLSPKTVEAMELIRWAVRGSLLNMDD